MRKLSEKKKKKVQKRNKTQHSLQLYYYNFEDEIVKSMIVIVTHVQTRHILIIFIIENNN